MTFNVLVTRIIPDAGLELLRQWGAALEVDADDAPLAHEELIEKVRGRDGVLCRLNDTIDAAVMEAARGARVFANFAVGFDNIDVSEATRRGIVITNTPGVLTDATADLAWTLLLATARKICAADRFVREGKFKYWGATLFVGADIPGRTLGIIGAGRIGAAVALRARGFGMNVLYSNPSRRPELEEKIGARWTNMEELLRLSDFISLHVPLKPETRHLIGERELGLMKPTAILINTSRGPVIDEAALVRALQNGVIFGAGLDVFENEPELAPGLMKMENTVLLPHIGSASVETRNRMAIMAAENLIAVLDGRRPPNCVNPEVLS